MDGDRKSPENDLLARSTVGNSADPQSAPLVMSTGESNRFEMSVVKANQRRRKKWAQ